MYYDENVEESRSEYKSLRWFHYDINDCDS